MQTVLEEQTKVFVSVMYYADDARAAAVHVDFSTAVHEALVVHGMPVEVKHERLISVEPTKHRVPR
jgi:hypothetical protein